MAISPLPPAVTEQARTRVLKEMLAFALIFAAFLLYLFVAFSDHGFLAMYHAKARLRAVEAELKNAKRENTGLKEAIAALRDHPESLESLAREELRMVKPGETLYLFLERKASPSR